MIVILVFTSIISRNLFLSKFVSAKKILFIFNTRFNKVLKFNPLDDEIKETLADLEGALCGCKYYVENQFHKFKEQFCKNYNKQLSLLCFNINGLPKKKDQLEMCVGVIGKMTESGSLKLTFHS